MPIDLMDADRRITIANRSGDVLPFSRGILASSLLSTGIATEEAYRLASVVQSRLLKLRTGAIDAEQLVGMIHEILVDEEPDGTAGRWLAWRTAKRSGRPVVVVFSGAPGVGKSTVAARMAVRFGISSLITSDSIRDVLRTVIPASVLPELHRSTFELVDSEGPGQFSNFDRQANAVANATIAVAHRLAAERRSAVLEGVHLLPGLMGRALASHPARPIVVERLIIERSDDAHKAKLERRAISEPLRLGARHIADIARIRAIQSHLQARADASGTPTIGTANLAMATHEIVDEIAGLVENEGVES
jgi:2-phosphoglycerate kinase